ncbi:uncharacterized protein LY79DRAFT_261398 [Colletotrichum navitas]|uniref:Uncharacterized protein n=1 Tax=Colletotrichum navitas TaxID=681940 RepID=A0AAD8V1X6_9PEZI|nr:uncharacterized protein LY79DRAFT_261398 [Colletotrichum navitas]KAK1585816.1 hypothetical protein LY79DRAFT_261398 [Colletotrichum navitas]
MPFAIYHLLCLVFPFITWLVGRWRKDRGRPLRKSQRQSLNRISPTPPLSLCIHLHSSIHYTTLQPPQPSKQATLSTVPLSELSLCHYPPPPGASRFLFRDWFSLNQHNPVSVPPPSQLN